MLLRVFSVCLLASYVSTEEKAGETCSEATDTDVSDLVRVYEVLSPFPTPFLDKCLPYEEVLHVFFYTYKHSLKEK